MRVGVYAEGATQFLQIDLPTGHVRFALRDDDPEWTIFGPDMDMVNDFDGDEDSKWARIWKFVHGPPTATDQYVVASFRQSMLNLERQLALARDQRAQSGRLFRAKRAAVQRLTMIFNTFFAIVSKDESVSSEAVGRLWQKANNLVDMKIRENEAKEDQPT
jgi:hypothetical protein